MNNPNDANDLPPLHEIFDSETSDFIIANKEAIPQAEELLTRAASSRLHAFTEQIKSQMQQFDTPTFEYPAPSTLNLKHLVPLPKKRKKITPEPTTQTASPPPPAPASQDDPTPNTTISHTADADVPLPTNHTIANEAKLEDTVLPTAAKATPSSKSKPATTPEPTSTSKKEKPTKTTDTTTTAQEEPEKQPDLDIKGTDDLEKRFKERQKALEDILGKDKGKVT